MEGESDYVRGVINTSSLRKLSRRAVITMVSPSPFYPKESDGSPTFPIFANEASSTYRHSNLNDSVDYCKKTFGETPTLKLYVSNNGDLEEARKAGFVYIDAVNFKEGLI